MRHVADGGLGRHDGCGNRPPAGPQGLAAAPKPKPTVAKYALYFKDLQLDDSIIRILTLRRALRHVVMVMFGRLPEEGSSMRKSIVRKLLKRLHRFYVSFPKIPVLRRVDCSSRSLSVALLP
jgi:hypothetical protein